MLTLPISGEISSWVTIADLNPNSLNRQVFVSGIFNLARLHTLNQGVAREATEAQAGF